jgi:hypothetical protein
MQPGDLPEPDEEIGDEEYDERGDHGRHFTMEREGNSRKVLPGVSYATSITLPPYFV